MPARTIRACPARPRYEREKHRAGLRNPTAPRVTARLAAPYGPSIPSTRFRASHRVQCVTYFFARCPERRSQIGNQ